VSHTYEPPFVGALLRLCWQRTRRKMHGAIRAAGFTDLLEDHLAFFSYPVPDGVRPSEIARRIGRSRQSANYLIGQMETLGYLTRRSAAPGDRRLVWLTARGHAVQDTIYASLVDLQDEWAKRSGEAEFATAMRVLRQIALQDPS
jgi:DNA-binding MarR family transcriptional regulator